MKDILELAEGIRARHFTSHDSNLDFSSSSYPLAWSVPPLLRIPSFPRNGRYLREPRCGFFRLDWRTLVFFRFGLLITKVPLPRYSALYNLSSAKKILLDVDVSSTYCSAAEADGYEAVYAAPGAESRARLHPARVPALQQLGNAA